MTSDLDPMERATASQLAPPLLALLLVGGCVMSPSVDQDDMSCKTDDDCVAGYVCSAGRCIEAGVSSLDAAPQAGVQDGAMTGRDEAAAPSMDSGTDLAAPMPDLAPLQADVPLAADAPVADVPSSGSGGAGGTTAGTGGRIAGTGGNITATGGVLGSGGSGGTSSTSTIPIVDCGQPVGVAHGSFEATSTTAGSQATYACDPGYDLSGASQRTCQPDGTWSDSAPTCVLVDCGALAAPTYGSVESPSTTFSSVATYSCTPGFVLNGNATRTCQANGAWDGIAPSCQCPDGQSVCGSVCVDLQNDNHNCGGCDLVCSTTSPSTAQCTAGRCLVTLAAGQESDLEGIAVDAASVYWINFSTGAVSKVPLGGGVTTTLATGPANPLDITVAGSTIYWTTFLYSQNVETVLMIPTSGGVPTTLASDQTFPNSIAVDDKNAYWTDVSAGNVMKVPLGGGTPTPLATGQGAPYALAVDATNIYWVDEQGGTVMKLPLTGGTPTVLASGQAHPSDIAVDGTSVYWTNDNTGVLQGGSVAKVPKGGGSPVVLAPNQTQPRRLVVDAANVYFITYDVPARVNKVPLGGGTLTTIVSLPTDLIFALAVDGTSVYWTTNNAVMKVTPK